ncbi:MAG: calcium/sodium antiporter [Pseudomonadota bacterium]
MLAALVIAGLVLLLLGGEGLVRGAVALANRAGVSPMFVGVVLLGFGTSAPELVACVQAVLAGAPGVALGNVLGSNTANILLILGVAALLIPVPVGRDALKRDGGVMLVSSLALAGLAILGRIGTLAGLILIAGLIAYIAYAWMAERRDDEEIERDVSISLPLSLFFALGGLAAILVGGRLLVDGAVGLAEAFGVSDTVVGLTVVAVGTSLPELAASAAAAYRKEAGLIIGNVLGSNIYNILGILGVTSLVGPLPVPASVLSFDVPVMLAATVLLLALGWWRGVLGRAVGASFLAAYIGYTAILWI